jgi:hypothetical protein
MRRVGNRISRFSGLNPQGYIDGSGTSIVLMRIFFVDNDKCPATWDGWQCFDDTNASATVIADCPTYIHGETIVDNAITG